jgi:Histidine kinase-, DNA gyrase B-, and HSP90-like ATPase/His Kinase A (phospho-acceptor) domain
LRTPLNAILGFAQVMQGDPSLSDDYQDYVNSIYDSGEHLLKLINNILAIARMDTKSSSADEKEIDLHHVLDTIRQSFTARIQAKKLKLTLDYAPNIPRYIRTNERNLRQILMNLLDNAIQFTDQGHIILRVAGYLPRREDAPEPLTDSIQRISSTLYFEIEDTGAGIAPDEIEQVFKAFMQAKLGRKSGKGLGLGLAISQQLVRGMDGELSVESTVGKGTIFRFHIKVGTLSQSHLAHLSNTSHLINAHLPVTAIATTTPIHPSPSIRLSEEQMLKTLTAIMPKAWVYELHHAAIRGLDQEIVQLIEQIPQDCTYCAELLKDWTEHFLFNKIIDLTQKISSTWGQGS